MTTLYDALSNYIDACRHDMPDTTDDIIREQLQAKIEELLEDLLPSLETRCYDAHDAYIEEHGIQVTNLGWSVDISDNGVVVISKTTRGRLATTLNVNGNVFHNWV